MFNPSNVSNAKAEKAAKKKALAELKVQSEALIPQELHEGKDASANSAGSTIPSSQRLCAY